MTKERINAFSDGVMAILITILVLNIKIPLSGSWASLFSQKFGLITYLISFITIAIYWNNHHHLFQLLDEVNGGILWWNMIYLLGLSFLPFSTAWLAEFPASQAPEVVFGLNYLFTDFAFSVLSYLVYKQQKHFGNLKETNWSWKTVWSHATIIIGLFVCVIFSFNFAVLIGTVLSWLPWVIPDRQVEKKINEKMSDD